MRISIRDIDQVLYVAKQEGINAIKNKKKNPFIRNPYLDGSNTAKAWDEGAKEESNKLSTHGSWKLFLDDERNPESDDWIIARSAQEAKDLVMAKGCPNFIAFDHDLGYTIPEEMKGKNPNDYPMAKTPIGYFREGVKIEETGLDFAKWLVKQDQDGKIKFPKSFDFHVHSANPEGRKNIQSYMDSYLKSKNQEL